MIDRDRLSRWIQPQHLEDGALESYRQAFTSHPARLLNLKNFLVPAVADRLSKFLASEAEFRPEFGLYSVEGPVPEEQWQAAPEEDRFFRYGRLIGTPPQFQASPNAMTYLQFRMTFQRPEFRAWFAAATGLDLGPSDDFGAHSMGRESLLRPHTDDNRNRRVAIVVYLTPGWEPGFGGALRVVHPDDSYTEITSDYNSMIVFDVLTSPAHYVMSVHPREGGPTHRLTIGGWYHKPA